MLTDAIGFLVSYMVALLRYRRCASMPDRMNVRIGTSRIIAIKYGDYTKLGLLRTPKLLLTRYLPLAATTRICTAGGQINHVAVAHATLGDDALGELLHVGALALEDRNLHAAFVVEMHMQRRLR